MNHTHLTLCCKVVFNYKINLYPKGHPGSSGFRRTTPRFPAPDFHRQVGTLTGMRPPIIRTSGTHGWIEGSDLITDTGKSNLDFAWSFL